MNSDNNLNDLERIINNTDIAIVIVNETREFEFWNKAFIEELGYSNSDISGKKVDDLIHPDDLEIGLGYFGRRMREDPTVPSEYELRVLNGKGETIITGISAVKTSYKGRPAVQVNVRDITEKKKIDDELAYFKLAFDGSPTFLGFADIETLKVTYMNSAMMKAGGVIDGKEAQNTFIYDYVTKEFSERLVKYIIPIVKKEGRWQGEGEFVNRKTGEKVYVNAGVEIVKSPSLYGKPKLFAIMEDITKNKELEEYKRNQLRNMTHNFMSPFSTLLSSTDFLKIFYTKVLDDDGNEIVDNIQETAKTIMRRMKNLLTVSRIEENELPYEPSVYNLKEGVQKTIDLFTSSAKIKNITIENEINSEMIGVYDSNLMHSVYENLINNAIKFSKPGGKITLSAEKKDNNYYISISDNGMGMDKERVENLFNINLQPVNGTYNETGTGSGLKLVKYALDKQGSNLSVQSELGKGTTLTFCVQKYNEDK